jgi:hypothetical protein
MRFPERIIFVLALLCFSLQSYAAQPRFRYWDEMEEADQIKMLHTPGLSPFIADYVEGRLNFRDSSSADKMSELARSLEKADPALLPLYFHVLQKLSAEKDSRIPDMLGVACFRFLKQNPEYVLNSFTDERVHDKSYPSYLNYAACLGSELCYVEKGSSRLNVNFNVLAKQLNDTFRDADDRTTQTLRLFLWEVRRKMDEKMDKS